MTEEKVSKRTSQQNRGLHLFFTLLSDSLNDAGLDQRKVLKPSVSIPWTLESVKEQLWKPIQKLMYNKNSTTDLDKKQEIEKIHETLMRHLGESFGVDYIPFPSETQLSSLDSNFIANNDPLGTISPWKRK